MTSCGTVCPRDEAGSARPKSQQTATLAGGDLRKPRVISIGGYTLPLLASNGVSMINRYLDRAAPGPARRRRHKARSLRNTRSASRTISLKWCVPISRTYTMLRKARVQPRLPGSCKSTHMPGKSAYCMAMSRLMTGFGVRTCRRLRRGTSGRCWQPAISGANSA
jgi:hypothetical protein